MPLYSILSFIYASKRTPRHICQRFNRLRRYIGVITSFDERDNSQTSIVLADISRVANVKYLKCRSDNTYTYSTIPSLQVARPTQLSAKYSEMIPSRPMIDHRINVRNSEGT